MKIDWGEIIYNSGDVFLPDPVKKYLDKSICILMFRTINVFHN